ncbi:MAG TPA: nucleoside permease [Flavisolibacter sp.]|jgi:nucleoside transporter|nr:nucleoside permease [Flavisolibacter sp.]
MKTSVRIQLSVMMFIEFFIWGAWYVTMATYLKYNLNATDPQQGFVYTSQSFGAILAPFIIGFIADRFFAAQKILVFLHLAGAVVLWYITTVNNFQTFFPLIIIYMVLYMPTIGLTNAVAFKQMSNPSKEFPGIRVLGTIGWIVAGLIIGWLGWEATQANHTTNLALTFKMASIASLVLAVICLTLPNTPPPKAKDQNISIREVLGFDAFSLFKNKNYLIFFIASIAISIPLAFYYNFTNVFLKEINVKAGAGIQTIGQMSEVIFILILPLLFIKWGVKKILVIGMIAWGVRYFCFAYGDNEAYFWMILIGIALHGVCYDFFFVTGQIYTEQLAGEKFKSAAQGLITLATYGIGMLIGFFLSGYIVEAYAHGTGHDWTSIWIVPAIIAVVVLILFGTLFRQKKSPAPTVPLT